MKVYPLGEGGSTSRFATINLYLNLFSRIRAMMALLQTASTKR